MFNRVAQFASKRWAVVGFTHDGAKEIIEDIVSSSGKEVSRRLISKNMLLIEFSDGTTLQHIRASENSRGYRIGRMWCDRDINKDILHCVIMPMYFGDRDDIVWL